ncbi:hypothetical protein FQR65_LT15923 [Abscondita terminalis]|nr:hypothetical protein FQR65_LT15923 [Abscondita terminalis]
MSRQGIIPGKDSITWPQRPNTNDRHCARVEALRLNSEEGNPSCVSKSWIFPVLGLSLANPLSVATHTIPCSSNSSDMILGTCSLPVCTPAHQFMLDYQSIDASLYGFLITKCPAGTRCYRNFADPKAVFELNKNIAALTLRFCSTGKLAKTVLSANPGRADYHTLMSADFTGERPQWKYSAWPSGKSADITVPEAV